jgi:hypothetical protein
VLKRNCSEKTGNSYNEIKRSNRYNNILIYGEYSKHNRFII